jgi:2-hydroxycyclohexanecarboxyl-CoA dehydrogenase
MRGLKDKTVIVTGGGGGIGGAACLRFAAEGAKVAVFDINKEAAEATVAAIVAAKGRAKAFSCDISDYAAVQAAVAAVRAELRPFLQTTPADWQRLIAINLVGALNMHHVVLPEMVERRSGRVVNVASDAGRVGSSGESVYSACKGAMISLSKTLARENASKGISINVVCPGPTETKLLTDVVATANNPEKLLEAFRRAVPMGRLGLADDLPGAICFFASDDAAFITGQVLSVSGGLTMSG